VRKPDEIVGRESELASIESFLDAVPSGTSALVIEGEPGLGKTVLWQLAAGVAERRGFRVLRARPAEPESRLSYAGLADILGSLGEEVAAALPAPQQRALNVALLREEPGARPPDQRAVATAVLGCLRALADRTPVVVAIDDVQWLDAPSLHVLQFAFRRTGGAPTGLLATRRMQVGEAAGDPALSPVEGATRLALGPLSLGALQRLLTTRLGAAFPHATLVRIRQAAGGNPFFALEIAGSLQRTGVPLQPGAPIPVPSSLHELLRARLSELSAPAQEVMAAASALSQASIPILIEVGGDAARVGAALREAAEAHVVQVEDERVRFTHPLLGSAVYMSVPAPARRALHGRLAEAVSDPEERARHLAIAVNGPNAEAAAACEQGALAARSRAAPDNAAYLALRAAALTPVGDAEALTRRTLAAAQNLYDFGETEEARRLLRRRVSELDRGPDRAQVLHRLAVIEGELGPALDSIRLFEQALAEAPEEGALAVRIGIDLAWMLSWGADTAVAATRAREALERAEALGDESLVGQASLAVAALEFSTGAGLRDDLMRRAVELEPSMTDVPLDRAPSAIYGLQLMRLGQIAMARPFLERVLQLATDRGEETNLSAASFYLARLEIMSGDWDKAREHVERGQELATLTGVNRLEMLYADAMFDAHAGRLDQARSKIDRGLRAAREAVEPMAVSRFLSTLGFIELTESHHEAARAAFSEARQTLAAMAIQEPGTLSFLPDQVEACVSTGDIGGAREITSWLEERAQVLQHPWAAAAAARCRGVLLSAEGRPDLAARALTDSKDRFRELGMPFQAARSALLLGQAQRRGKLKRPARESLQEALEIFERLGAPSWAERARVELGRIGGRPSTPHDLTASEQEVAALVAAGHSNRQVAERLYMTVNTVETNLSRIYRKLGVRSRTELAATIKARA